MSKSAEEVYHQACRVSKDLSKRLCILLGVSRLGPEGGPQPPPVMNDREYLRLAEAMTDGAERIAAEIKRVTEERNEGYRPIIEDLDKRLTACEEVLEH